jgi:anti-sigma B factor antagonist
MSLEFHLDHTTSCSILSLKGKILSENELDKVKEQVFPMDTPQKNWVVDLSELTHTNSSGISFLVKMMTRSRVNNGELVICGVSGSVETLFKLAKIDLIFTIFNTPSEAKDFFKAKA